MRFELQGLELERAKDFISEHQRKHGRDKSAIGGRYTCSFTPTSIGTIAKIKCFCGTELDVSDYDCW